ncbi:MAG TPA: hypothetical protein ENK78_01685 [Thiothrix sp.]|nr:hypothetical protein [Thiothrix sp.]
MMVMGLSLLASSSTLYAVAFDEPSSHSVQKDFQVNVTKQSSILLQPNTPEVVELDIDSLVNLDMATDDSGNITAPPIPIPLGELTLETSATSCAATITSTNNFALKGLKLGKTLATYEVLYSNGLAGEEGSPTIFGASSPNTQIVGCETASLDFTLLSITPNTPEDDYDDVIRVTLEAES